MKIRINIILILLAALAGISLPCPLPAADSGPRPSSLGDSPWPAQLSSNWLAWKRNYLLPAKQIPGAFKVNFDRKGTTVSEAMGYGMLLAVYAAAEGPDAQKIFDGLNLFRKAHPSSLNPALMCWKIPANEKNVRNDCATDGDLDMAFALLLAHRQWRDDAYLVEATNYINAIATALVRPDFSLRLGDWNSAAGQTRLSDFMPSHFRSFYSATGDGLWTNVENQCYAILEQLQTNYATATGLIPDFAVATNGFWHPAKPKFLESPNDGSFYYNSCRVPWRIGWAASANNDPRALRILSRFMAWATNRCETPGDFRAGYRLDGSDIPGNDYQSACFISPTGVAAMATGNQKWLDAACAFPALRHGRYYEDSVNLLSLLAMSGKAWLP